MILVRITTIILLIVGAISIIINCLELYISSKIKPEQYKEYEIASKEAYDEIQIKIYQSLIVSIVYSGFGLWIGFAYDVF